VGSENRARLAFAGLLLATLLAFSQLFDEGPYLRPALLGALLAAAGALAARRAGISSAATLALSGVGLLWYSSVVFAARKLFFGLPTPAALGGLGAWIGRASRAASIDFAPVPPRPGYVIVLTAALWIAAALGEVATFRWRRPLAASVAPIALFSLVMVVGSGVGTALFLSLFLGALFTFWGVESSHRLRSWGRWVTAFSQGAGGPGSPSGSVARRMGASCVAAALVAPLVLPRIEEGLVAWRTGRAPGGLGTGAGPTQSFDLLVSLAPTLIEQTSRELFVVESEAPSYWRLTSLVHFDGRDWRPWQHDSVPLTEGHEVGPYQHPPSSQPSRLRTVWQRFEITGLASQALPAAVHASYIRLDEATGRSYDDLEVDVTTGEIRLRSGASTGLAYGVQSRVPDVSFAALQRAALGDPGSGYAALPPGISSEVVGLAHRWTAGAGSPFEKLVAIQDRLRSFEYSLDVAPEDSTDYLTQFLTKTRRGYCQQFATAFAVLARVLGYPTRVSVGFLPGAPTGRRPGEFRVSGSDAHAWPEVYFEEFGWVAFEPTPRSTAQEPSYTVPGFDAIGGREGGEGSTVPDPGTTGLRARLQDPGGRASDPLVPDAGARVIGNPAWLQAFNRLAGGLGLLVALFLLGVPLLKEWRIRAAYRRAASPTSLCLAAFAHFAAEGADLAAPRRSSESGRAYALRLARAGRAAGKDALELAAIYEIAQYSGRAVTSTQATQARRLAGRLRRALWRSAPWWQRCRRLFSPAGLVEPLGRSALS
jgi:hypothetical protein